MRVLSRLLAPIIICGVLAVFAGQSTWIHLQEFWRDVETRDKILQSLFILALAWLISRSMLVLMWAAETSMGKTPLLLKNLVVVAVFCVAILCVLGWIFHLPPSSLLATSGVAGVILGLAFRDTIADIFAGISLNAERPFTIGDWIRIEGLEIAPLIGCVEDIDWRTTKLRTADNVVIVVPNSKMRMMSLTNFTVAGNRTRFRLPVCLDGGIPVALALQVLQAAATAAEGPLADPPPKSQIDGFREDLGCVEYHVVYWLNPAEVSPHMGRHEVSSSVLRHLQDAGISLHTPKQALKVSRVSNSDSETFGEPTALLRRESVPSESDKQAKTL